MILDAKGNKVKIKTPPRIEAGGCPCGAGPDRQMATLGGFKTCIDCKEQRREGGDAETASDNR